MRGRRRDFFGGLCFLAASLSACGNCGSAPAPQRQPQAAPAEPPEGTPFPADSLTEYLPAKLPGFEAGAEPTAQSSVLPNGGFLNLARRVYTKGEQRLELEVNDALHVTPLRELVVSQQGVERKTANAYFRGAPIAGRPALVQWFGASRTALVNVLVGQRFLVNLKLSPASDPAQALALAQGLALERLEQLAGQEEPSAPASERAKPAAATPPPAPKQP